jgi:probable F420-dependent oxidoreductase
MHFGIFVYNKGPLASPEHILHLAQRAEALGFDDVAVTDHIAIPVRDREHDQFVTGKPTQPYVTGGPRHGWEEISNYYDPLTTLMYVACHTKRVRLGTTVLILPYRQPIPLAKTLATLDVLSGGRLFLGVGTGWWQDEFDALGIADHFATRGDRTDEAIRIMKVLWSQEVASFEGRFHRFRDIAFSPRPVQGARIPIWVAGNNPRALRRVAELGDVWHPVALRDPGLLTPESLPERRKALDRQMVKAGRDPASIEIALRCPMVVEKHERSPLEGTPERIAEDVRRYAKLGVTHLIIDLKGKTFPEVADQLEQIGQRVIPLCK